MLDCIKKRFANVRMLFYLWEDGNQEKVGNFAEESQVEWFIENLRIFRIGTGAMADTCG